MSSTAAAKLAQLDEILPRIVAKENDGRVFRRFYEQYLTVPSLVDWARMKVFDQDKYQEDYALIPEPSAEEARRILARVAVVKLNGGLGTTMGCAGPKSLIEIKDGKSFLEFAVLQNQKLNAKHGSAVPLLLMDSYRTEEATRRWLQEHGFGTVRQFVQSKCPRIYEDTLLPVPDGPDSRPEDGTFNTNNIWVDLNAVKRKLSTMKLEVLPNKKKLSDGRSVIQLESAIGGAIRNFERSRVVFVPRARFLPVKKTQDLLVVMSNAFEVDEDQALRLSAARRGGRAPVVHLSPEFDSVADFARRFPYIPDLSELDTLKVSGDVTFGRDVKLRGTVTVEAPHGGHVPDNAVLEGPVLLQ